MAKKKTSDLVIETLELRQNYKQVYLDYYMDLLMNSIKITGADLPKEAPADYLKNKLIHNGCIAFDKAAKLWLPYSMSGMPNAYGRYTEVQLTGIDGTVLTRKIEEVALIRFTPAKSSLYNWLELMIDDIVDLRIAIRAQAIKHQTPIAFDVNDDTNILSLKNEFMQRKLGVPVIFTSSAMREARQYQADEYFTIDKLQLAIKSYENAILTRLGIVAGNADKKERVQSFDLPIDYAIDSIYTMIDTFNKDCQENKVDAKMEINGAIEDLYSPDNNKDNNNNVNAEESEAVANEAK